MNIFGLKDKEHAKDTHQLLKKTMPNSLLHASEKIDFSVRTCSKHDDFQITRFNNKSKDALTKIPHRVVPGAT